MRRSVLSTGLAILAIGFFQAPAEAQNDFGCGGNRRGSLSIIGLTSDQRLVCFRENNPGGARGAGAISGLSGDTRLVGIDVRPATGELWGLGDAGGLYVIDVRDGGATFKSQLSVALAGTSFGIDFNPTVDRLRIISDTGQNLRVNVDTGAVTVDTNLSGLDPLTGVTAAAYTNNDADGNTGTTLYVIDTAGDQLAIQAPPNAGSLNATGKLTVNAAAGAGFDIYSYILRGTTVEAWGYAVLTVNGQSRLYHVNLFTGRATPRGTFRSREQVIDIAIPLNR